MGIQRKFVALVVDDGDGHGALVAHVAVIGSALFVVVFVVVVLANAVVERLMGDCVRVGRQQQRRAHCRARLRVPPGFVHGGGRQHESQAWEEGQEEEDEAQPRCLARPRPARAPFAADSRPQMRRGDRTMPLLPRQPLLLPPFSSFSSSSLCRPHNPTPTFFFLSNLYHPPSPPLPFFPPLRP